MNIGEKIYNLRKKKNLSQEDLASILNVSRQTISKWETGESNPELDKIVPICNFFEISTDEFLKGKDIVYERKFLKEQKKNKALTFSLCLIIFGIMVMISTLLEEVQVSDSIISVIVMLGLTLIGVLLIYYFMATPKKDKQDLKSKVINRIVMLITILVYLVTSFLWNIWEYSWIILVIGFLVMYIVKLIRLLGEIKDEKE